MQFNILIKGGTVVDGTGAPARKADVRISNGLITEVGPDLPVKGRERIVDAEGCYVSPGFIETHNHYDAPLWWMPNLEPMSGYGITTSVNGNCGFSAAPMSDNEEANMEMIKIFSFFEDIPIKPFLEIPAWDWKKWSEYKDSMQRNLRMPVNMDFYCGHQALRLAAMGLDARERAATPQEIGVMADLLRDALAAGALGFSSNTMDYDGQGRPVPSLLADDAEFSALFDVLDEFPGKTFQILLSVFMRMTGVSDMQRLEPLLEGRKFKVMWAGVPT
ncbi:MAG: D-aminoacylase, partial [Hyphomicrobiales bacterium]